MDSAASVSAPAAATPVAAGIHSAEQQELNAEQGEAAQSGAVMLDQPVQAEGVPPAAGISAEVRAALDGQLYDAALNGDAAAIERLVEAGASPNAMNSADNPAVLLAAAKGYADVVSALVRLGADPDARNRDGWTGLMIAALNDKVESVRALLTGGADRNPKLPRGDWKGKTALDIANMKSHAEVYEMLRTAAGAEEQQGEAAQSGAVMLDQPVQAEGVPPAAGISAEVRADAEDTQQLLAQMQEPEVALVNAIARGSTEEVATLLRDGADPGAMYRGYTPLMFAAMNGNVVVIDQLINAGAHPNIRDGQGYSALMSAAAAGHAAAAIRLADVGTNISFKSGNGKTAIELARDRGHEDLAKMLSQRAAAARAAGRFSV